jgi:hypothetical protein
MKFSELPVRKKHGWLYFGGFLWLGFAMMPIPLPDAGLSPLIAGICFGEAVMIGLFVLGKKEAGEVN